MSRLLNRLWATARVLRTMGASATLLALPLDRRKQWSPWQGARPQKSFFLGSPTHGSRHGNAWGHPCPLGHCSGTLASALPGVPRQWLPAPVYQVECPAQSKLLSVGVVFACTGPCTHKATAGSPGARPQGFEQKQPPQRRADDREACPHTLASGVGYDKLRMAQGLTVAQTLQLCIFHLHKDC